MSQEPRGDLCFGIILITVPIFALIFGSDEPAMQTDNAALVMTGMIFFGIIMLANAGSKRKKVVSPQPTYQVPVIQAPNKHSAFCSHCGASITIEGAQYCASCGKAIQSSSSTQQHGFSRGY